MTTIRRLVYGPVVTPVPAWFAPDVEVCHGYFAFPRKAGPLNPEDENGGTYAGLMADGDIRATIAGNLAERFPFDPKDERPVFIDMEHWRLPHDADATEQRAFRQWVRYVYGLVILARPKADVYFDADPDPLGGFTAMYPTCLYPSTDDLYPVLNKYFETVKGPRERGLPTVVTNWRGGIPGAPLSDDVFRLQMLVARLLGGEVWVWCQQETPEQAQLSAEACARVAGGIR